jgi:hypothetical protein
MKRSEVVVLLPRRGGIATCSARSDQGLDVGEESMLTLSSLPPRRLARLRFGVLQRRTWVGALGARIDAVEAWS